MGRPEGENRSAQLEGIPMSAADNTAMSVADADLGEPDALLAGASHSAVDGLLDEPLVAVIGRPPVSCAPHTPVRDVLQTMSREEIGSIVVVDPGDRPIGIFTFHDLLDKVALPQADLSRPISETMSRGLATLPSSATVLDAIVLMAREGIRHVPLVEGERLVGLVSESRLFSLSRGGLHEARTALHAAASVDDVRRTAGDMRALACRLYDRGMGAEAITRLVTAFNDAVAQRLLDLVDGDGAFAAAGACLVVMGSEGRGEQTLATDQDNAIIVGDDAPAGARDAVVAVGRRLNEALDACGYPLCRGNIMAGNPRWCASLSEWRRTFAGWIDLGDPQALLHSAVFFDFRPVHGDPALASQLRGWLTRYAADHGRFLLQMAVNAQNNQPPLGLVRDFVLTGTGEHADSIDLKINGVQPFVEAARIYSLAAGVPETGTVARLRGVAKARRIADSEVGAWIEAFRFLQQLRVRLNFEQYRQRRPLHNYLDPDTLNALDRRILKEAFREAKKLQGRLARDFGSSGGGFGV
jgi:CBS domain-containing protein